MSLSNSFSLSITSELWMFTWGHYRWVLDCKKFPNDDKSLSGNQHKRVFTKLATTQEILIFFPVVICDPIILICWFIVYIPTGSIFCLSSLCCLKSVISDFSLLKLWLSQACLSCFHCIVLGIAICRTVFNFCWLIYSNYIVKTTPRTSKNKFKRSEIAIFRRMIWR